MHDLDDEAMLSEITILPDGRVCVFGASRGVLEVLSVLNPRDAALGRRLAGAEAPREDAVEEKAT